MKFEIIILITSVVFGFSISCGPKENTTPNNGENNHIANSEPVKYSTAESESEGSWERENQLSGKVNDDQGNQVHPEGVNSSTSKVDNSTVPKKNIPKTVSTGSQFSNAEAVAIVNYHNLVRGKVKAGNIKWNNSVAKFAQNWADKLSSMGCKMEHRKNNVYGENLWMGTASAFTVVDAAKSWESEKKYYSGGKLNSGNWYKSGHYTQMVWKKSKGLGCGKVVCNGQMVVVCNYNPAGNFMGQTPY